jgi:DNA-binding protein HU-beta
MTANEKARDHADAQFTRKQMAATEGAKARAEYEAEGQAIRARTEKLKQARLARDAAAALLPKPEPKKKTTKAKSAATPAAKLATKPAIKALAKRAKAAIKTPSPRAAK